MAAVEQQKYRVIKRLEAGGMAEVYLGEAVSVQGFRKKVAIKRVLPHLAQNQSFIEMFLDEARLSARLDHANIVSVFDISKREDTYFLIMEFVDGVNLKRVLESLTKRGQRIRMVDAVHLAIEACRGLSYAHELVDEQGKPPARTSSSWSTWTAPTCKACSSTSRSAGNACPSRRRA